MTIFTGHSISQFQRCKRISAIEQTHRVTQWHASILLSTCLRWAIFKMSEGDDPNKVSKDAVLYFLAAAKKPGLDVMGIDTYTYAMDHVATLRNVLEHLSRVTLLELHHIPDHKISEDVSWRFMSSKDQSGVLHRWHVVDYIPKDITEELHGWEVYGDMAAADAPMVLHLIAVGRREGSHLVSPWTRTYAHPVVANTFKFNKVSGAGLRGKGWKPIYFSANSASTPKAWVDWMERDNAIEPLILHANLKELSSRHIMAFEHQVCLESIELDKALSVGDPRALPMSRYACDKPYVCPHQGYCYTDDITLDDVGVYTKVNNQKELVNV